MRRLVVALVHHPVVDKSGAVVTSAVTNLDVHDLSRSALTFGAETFFVTTPIAAQRELVEAIAAHWRDGSSGRRIPSRKLALDRLRVVPSVDGALDTLGGRSAVEIWVTAARSDAGGALLSFEAARQRLRSDDPRAVMILFGTSWGLAPEVCASADARLPPIDGVAGYNHLSVRAACAITLDRLVS